MCDVHQLEEYTLEGASQVFAAERMHAGKIDLCALIQAASSSRRWHRRPALCARSHGGRQMTLHMENLDALFDAVATHEDADLKALFQRSVDVFLLSETERAAATTLP